jgi:hypothetical protein
MTDSDSPSAAVFRLPNERLLDNDVHLRNRTAALEAANAVSSITSLVATTTGTALIASRNLAANEAVAGTSFRFGATLQAVRASTATAVTIDMGVLYAGSPIGTNVGGALNTTNGYTGALRLEGEVTFHSAPGAAASVTIVTRGFSTLVSATVLTFLPTPSLVDTVTTNAPRSISMRANISAPVAGVSFTVVNAYLERITP